MLLCLVVYFILGFNGLIQNLPHFHLAKYTQIFHLHHQRPSILREMLFYLEFILFSYLFYNILYISPYSEYKSKICNLFLL